MNFRKAACAHLTQYKRDFLGILEDGIFRYKGQDILEPHILPKVHGNENILEEYRARFWSSERPKIKLHRYFHHLNSSQALCINLFYPLMVNKELRFFLEFLFPDTPVRVGSGASFEKESDIEVADRRTSFDFWVQLADSGNILVEVKYSEAEFGHAENDDEHQAKFCKTYLPLVQNSPFLTPKCADMTLFLRHYQILRNLVHITSTSKVVLLFPRANTAVARQAENARKEFLTDAGRDKLIIVFLEDLVPFLERKCSGGSLDGYYQAFRDKYFTPEMGN